MLAVLRHASTAWNELGRMQGRRDIPLSPRGRAEATEWRLPAEWVDAECIASPLCRAIDTAARMTGRHPRIEPALTEMDWGEWEGFTLAELRARHGAAFAANEDRGLDFRPPQGESPRDVLARVRPWLRDLAPRQAPTVAVTHKGVLHALLVEATGWDMTGRPPVKLRPACMHSFAVRPGGGLSILRCNVPLIGPEHAQG